MENESKKQPTEKEISDYYVTTGIQTIIAFFISGKYRPDEIEKVLTTLLASYSVFSKTEYDTIAAKLKESFDTHVKFMEENPDATKTMKDIIKEAPEGITPFQQPSSDKDYLN
jgi:hypothetical protein